MGIPNLKIVATPTTGLNHLDVEYLNSRKVKIISLRDARKAIENISSTTEITLWHIINIVEASTAAHSVSSKNEWLRDNYRSRQLSNMVLGIVGLGRIGFQIAKVCSALGMKVYFYDPYLSSNLRLESYDNLVRINNIAELLEKVK